MTTRPLRILIVAVNYAPERGGTAPYTADAAEHLARAGHTVEVLTGMPHYPSWRVAAEYAGRFRARELRNGVRLRRLRHYVPTSQSTAQRALYEASFAVHALASPRMRHPDVVLAVVPGILGAAAASLIARRSTARLVVWLQDSVSRGAAQTGIPGGRSVARGVAQVETRVLRAADEVIVISQSFGRQVAAAGVAQSRISLVRNWAHLPPPSVAREEMRSRMGWGAGEIIALHAGNMGMKQGLENVVDAGKLAHQQASNVRFVLMGDGNQRAFLQARARGVPNITFLPPVGDQEYSSVLAAADVLVLNERHGVRDMSLPSKLTSYLMAGRPVVAAVRDDGETATEVSRTGAGTVVSNDSPQALLSEVPRLHGDNRRPRGTTHNPSTWALGVQASEEAKAKLTRVIEGRGFPHA